MDLQERPPDWKVRLKNAVILFFVFYFITYCSILKMDGM